MTFPKFPKIKEKHINPHRLLRSFGEIKLKSTLFESHSSRPQTITFNQQILRFTNRKINSTSDITLLNAAMLNTTK